MQDFAQLVLDIAHFQAKQVAHLPVAILLDDVDALVRFDERFHIVGEGQRAQTEVAGLDAVLVAELVARLFQRDSRWCRRR